MRAVIADQAAQAVGPGRDAILLKIAGCVRIVASTTASNSSTSFAFSSSFAGRARPVRHLSQAGPAIERVRGWHRRRRPGTRSGPAPSRVTSRSDWATRGSCGDGWSTRAATRMCGARARSLPTPSATAPRPSTPRISRYSSSVWPSSDTVTVWKRAATSSAKRPEREPAGQQLQRHAARAKKIRHRHHVGTHQRLAARQHHDARTGALRDPPPASRSRPATDRPRRPRATSHMTRNANCSAPSARTAPAATCASCPSARRA